jgi:membrane-bound metal-dependent hydrolase YbcI (DUF457 family)
MFIGHLPAGYVANDLLQRTCWRRLDAVEKRVTTWAMLAGSLAPDLDMFYFYFVDGGKTHHHEFWPHLPSVWLGIGAVLALMGWLLKSRRLMLANAALMTAIFLHLVLDTVVGGVAWLHPWSRQLMVWVNVPAVHKPWYWNFFLHWTFLLEIGVILWATAIWLRRRKSSART